MEDKAYNRVLDGFLRMCKEDEELLQRRRQLMMMEEEYNE